jgi:hypothetical protein
MEIVIRDAKISTLRDDRYRTFTQSVSWNLLYIRSIPGLYA